MRPALLFILFIVSGASTSAQINYVDSLENLLKSNPKPQEKIEILADLVRELIRISPAKALQTGQTLKILSDSMDSDLGRAHYYRCMGGLSYIQGNYLYSTSFVFRAIELYSSLKDSIGIANSYVTLANSYSRQGLYHQAISYQKRALQIFTHNNNHRRIGVAFSNLSFLYNRIGKYDSALILINKSISLNKQTGSGSVLINDYKNQGNTFYFTKDFNRALESYNKALEINSQLGGEGNVESVIETLLGISKTYEALGRTEEALANTKRAIWLASKHGYIINLEIGFLQLSKQYKNTGNFKEAHRFLEHYADVIDSLRQIQRTELESLGDVYLNALRESNQNESLLKEKALQEKLITQQRISLLIGTCFIAVLGFLVFYLKKSNNRRRQINETLNLQKEEIAKQNKELEKLNQTKDKFFSIVAHDLKTPLNSLKAFTSILHNHAAKLTKEDIVETGKQLDETLGNTIKMADTLIVWAKQQMQVEEGVPEQLNIKQLVTTICEVYLEAADQKTILLTSDIPENLTVYGDKNQVMFVIRNLINNAIKFTKSGGQVKIIGVEPNHKLTQIAVSDTGIGMHEEVLKKVFEINANIKTKGTAGESGTGLGLVLCKEFVERNRGTIKAQSTYGLGTTFFVELPQQEG
jgi:signal transduction histidine kinase